MTKKISSMIGGGWAALALAGSLAAVTWIAAAPSTARADWFGCDVSEVGEFFDRLHVRCHNSIVLNGNTVRFICIAKTDAAMAARFLSTALSAQLSGRLFTADLPASSASNIPSCWSGDCRTPSVWMLND